MFRPETAKPMLAERPERQLVPQQHLGRVGHHDLAAMSGRHQPRRAIHLGAEVVTVAFGGFGLACLLATLNPAVAGGTSLQNVLQLPMALPPDNQAHQFYVSGNYAWTPKTRSTWLPIRTKAAPA